MSTARVLPSLALSNTKGTTSTISQLVVPPITINFILVFLIIILLVCIAYLSISTILILLMITSQKDLCTLMEKAMQADSIALDTEFIWERTYYPKLGLIQLALSSDECHLIDPTTIDDLSILGELLANPEVIKILHDAPQDLAILHRATGATPVNIFDTKLAAGFCGLSSTLSLAHLIEELLDIKLQKSETRTNWLQRPLSEDQVKYALDDVRYLRAARVILLSRVYSPEVLSFLEEELKGFHNTLSYHGLTDQERYTKVKGAGSLNISSLAILRELAGWREEQARKSNKPRGHIVPDNVLVTIARNRMTTPQQITNDSGISRKAAKKYLDEMTSAIETGISCPKAQLPPSLKSPRLSEKNKQDLEKLTKMIKLKSDTKGMDPHLLGNLSELKSFIKALSNPEKLKAEKLNSGWRQKFVSEFLM